MNFSNLRWISRLFYHDGLSPNTILKSRSSATAMWMWHLMTRSVSPKTILSWIKHRMRTEDKRVNWSIHTWHSLIKYSSTKTVGNTLTFPIYFSPPPSCPEIESHSILVRYTLSSQSWEGREYKISSIHQSNQITYSGKESYFHWLCHLWGTTQRSPLSTIRMVILMAVMRDGTSDHQFLLVEDGEGRKEPMTENKQTNKK